MNSVLRHADTLTAIVQRAQAGDADALEVLLLRLRPAVLRYLARRFPRIDATDAVEDVAQDTLLRVAERIARFRGTTDGELYGWTFAVARNLALEELRRAPPGAQVAPHSVPLAALQFSDTASRDPAGDDLDMRSAHAEQMSRLAVEGYDALPADTALLVWHRVIQGLAWAEIADVHATTPAGAKRRFQRVQQTLHRYILARVAAYAPDDAASLLAWIERVRNE